MLGKNLVLERSANLKTNQNTGFFKLQYLTNKLGYEVEYGNITRGLKCNNITWLFQVGIVGRVWACPKL